MTAPDDMLRGPENRCVEQDIQTSIAACRRNREATLERKPSGTGLFRVVFLEEPGVQAGMKRSR
jgi:hypothetical protein